MREKEERGRKKEGEQQPGVGVLWNLPETWQWTAMGEISAVVGGGTPSTANEKNFGGDVPWITPADMSTHTGKYISAGGRYLSHQGMGVSGAQWLPKNTVLFSSRAPIGYCAIASQPVTTNQGFKSFIPMEGINSEYLYYWLTSAKRHAEALASGTTFLELSAKKAAQIPVPIAPVTEQTRIVEKLEELLADLDAGVAELKSAQKKLAQYRQSLLKAAVEGQLTADWRAQHPPTETGAELLSRILKERRARWEAKQLEKFASQGKTPPKNWQHKYPEPVAPDVRNLPKLPEGWVWASVDQLLYGIEAGKSFKCDERPPHGYEVGVIKVSAVTWGEYDENESKTCLDESLICPELFVAEGDFLFSRANTINPIGACVISKKVTKKIMLSDKILRFHFSNDSMKLWLLNLLRSKFGRNQIETFSSGNQESMRNIGQEKIKQIAVPIPSQPEMMHTMNVLTRALNAATHQTAAINFSLKQTTAQRQNILRAAFAGELVSQDPNDEPASVLLARIRAQRAAQPPAKKPRGRKPKEDQHV